MCYSEPWRVTGDAFATDLEKDGATGLFPQVGSIGVSFQTTQANKKPCGFLIGLDTFHDPLAEIFEASSVGPGVPQIDNSGHRAVHRLILRPN